MDIFEQARNFPNADYMDMSTGYIYHIKAYNFAKQAGLPTEGIGVTDSKGNFLGFVHEKEN